MKRLTIILLLILAGCSKSELKPFTTDGCSGPPLPYTAAQTLCCRSHDAAYWKGGTRKQRMEADHALSVCIDKADGNGEIMEATVNMGGSPYWPTSYRWGYGWPYGHFYTPLQATNTPKKY